MKKNQSTRMLEDKEDYGRRYMWDFSADPRSLQVICSAITWKNYCLPKRAMKMSWLLGRPSALKFRAILAKLEESENYLFRIVHSIDILTGVLKN
jgi:hypothetical protein